MMTIIINLRTYVTFSCNKKTLTIECGLSKKAEVCERGNYVIMSAFQQLVTWIFLFWSSNSTIKTADIYLRNLKLYVWSPKRFYIDLKKSNFHVECFVKYE